MRPRLPLVGILLSLQFNSAVGMRLAAVSSVTNLYLRDSEDVAPTDGLTVPEEVMASRCITMVSPSYPRASAGPATSSTVVVRVVVRQSGKVSPLRVVSGEPALQAEAMNAVRLWRYKPFVRDGAPVDVTTEVRVAFQPEKLGGVVSHPNH
jgi:TonB family protein